MDWKTELTPERIALFIQVVLLLVCGIPLIYILSVLAGKAAKKRFSGQVSMLISKGILYLGVSLLIVTVMCQLKFNLSAFFGAAGIFGIAIGFASQTSVSNIISGLFLISEKPFQVGDVIKVGDKVGTILSIDLLSLKLVTFDNQFVRIPNETLIKTELTNVTKFPIRRIDIEVGVAYKENVDRVMEILADVAKKNPFCLDEPAPLIMFKSFGDSALEFLFGVWCAKTDYLALKNSIMRDIKERFDSEGIEIPFPHRTFHVAAAGDPLPIRIVSNKTDTK